MKRRLMAGLMGGALMAALLPVAVAAAPEGGCPPGGEWNLERYFVAMPGVDYGDLSDPNGDGYGCYKISRQQHLDSLTGFFEIWTWQDNSEPLSD